MNTNGGKGERGIEGRRPVSSSSPSPSFSSSSRYYPRRVDDKWRGCHRSPPLSYASDTTRTLYTNDSVRRVLYDFVVLRAAIVFPWSIRPVANQRSPLSRERSFSPSIRARLKGQLARRPTARVTIPINLFRDSEILRSAIFHKEGGRSLRRIQSCVRLDERPTGRVCTSEIGRRNEASVFLSILSSVPPSLVVSSRRRGRTKLGCEAMDIVARPPKRSFVLIVSRGSIANDQS